MNTVALRCSSLPRIIACPASLVPPELDIQPQEDNAEIGRAVHAALANVLLHNDPLADQVALDFAIERSEFMPLVGAGWGIWRKLAPSLKVLNVETLLTAWITPGLFLTGHPDILAEEGAVLAVIDWKTSGSSNDYRDALMGYALLKWEPGRWEGIKLATFWLREGIHDVEEVSEAELAKWVDTSLARMQQTDAYGPGSCCGWCPRRFECPALAAMNRSAALALAGEGVPDLAPAALAALKPQADALEKALKVYRSMLRRAVRDAGSLPLADGIELVIEQQEREAVLATAESMSILKDELGDDLLAALTVGKKRLMDTIAAQAPRGHKGKEKNRIMGLLRECGAVMPSTVERLSTRRVAKALEGEAT